jgi:hypothetical protein
MKTKHIHSQKIICQLSELETAANNHDKMAELHEKAGNERLGRLARLDAYARRLAHDYLNNAPGQGLKAALGYADRRTSSNV